MQRQHMEVLFFEEIVDDDLGVVFSGFIYSLFDSLKIWDIRKQWVLLAAL